MILSLFRLATRLIHPEAPIRLMKSFTLVPMNTQHAQLADGSPVEIHQVKIYNPPTQPTEFLISKLPVKGQLTGAGAPYWVTGSAFLTEGDPES